MMLPEDTEKEFKSFVGQVADYSAKLLRFVQVAFNAYTHTRPEGTWEVEIVPEEPYSSET
jgi:hypothetical protein